MAKYFPPDSWELDNPAIWESDQTRLLFKTLHAAAGRHGRAAPCTVLFFPKDGAGRGGVEAADHHAGGRGGRRPLRRGDRAQERRHRQAAVDRRPPDRADPHLSQRERAGRRRRSGDHDPRHRPAQGPRCGRPHPVQFRLGRNHGSGREMEILLATGEPGTAENARGAQDAAVETRRADAASPWRRPVGPRRAVAAKHGRGPHRHYLPGPVRVRRRAERRLVSRRRSTCFAPTPAARAIS